MLGDARPAGPMAITHTRSRGSAVIPLDAAGQAQVEQMLLLAEERGIEMPPGFELDAVQVFYGPELRIDELRLAGFDDAGRPWQAAGRAPLLEWRDNEPHLLEADVGRRHFSAVLLEGEPSMLSLLWDVTGMSEEPDAGEPYLLTGSSAVFQAVRDLLARSDLRWEPGDRSPAAELEGRRLRVAVSLVPEAEHEPSTGSVKGASGNSKSPCSDLEADLLDALVDRWLARARDAQGWVEIEVDELLRLRGLEPKKNSSGYGAGYHPLQRRRAVESLMRLRDLWVEASIPRRQLGSSDGPIELRGRAVELRLESIRRGLGGTRADTAGALGPDTASAIGAALDPAAWRSVLFRPGRVLGRLFPGPGRQVAHLPSKALEYDPMRRRHEKRLVRYLSWQWRIRASRGTYLRPYRVETLLLGIGFELDRRRPTAARERFETALDRLVRDRVIVGWQYERWRETAVRGWWRSWLEALVIVEPPGEIAKAYRTLSARPQKRLARGTTPRSRPASASSNAPNPDRPGASGKRGLPEGHGRLGERVGQRRRELALSQMQLAESAGLPRARLAAIEAGRRPSAADRRRLERWLEGG